MLITSQDFSEIRNQSDSRISVQSVYIVELEWLRFSLSDFKYPVSDKLFDMKKWESELGSVIFTAGNRGRSTPRNGIRLFFFLSGESDEGRTIFEIFVGYLTQKVGFWKTKRQILWFSRRESTNIRRFEWSFSKSLDFGVSLWPQQYQKSSPWAGVQGPWSPQEPGSDKIYDSRSSERPAYSSTTLHWYRLSYTRRAFRCILPLHSTSMPFNLISGNYSWQFYVFLNHNIFYSKWFLFFIISILNIV